MHILTVNALEQDIHHVIAAVKHWLSKIEQEVFNSDEGPAEDGVYEFDHDGKPTTVTWSASAQAVAPLPEAEDVADVDADELQKAQAELAAAGEKHPTHKADKPEPPAIFADVLKVLEQQEGDHLAVTVTNPTDQPVAGTITVTNAELPVA